MASLFPAVVKARKKSEQIYEQRVQKLYDLMVWGSAAIALPTTLLSDWIILTLYGTNFQEAADVLRIYIWAIVFVSLGVASSKWLITENLQRYSFYLTTLGAIVNVGCNLWFIPIYGIKGAAFATLMAQGIVSFVGLSFFVKTRKNCWKVTNAFNAYGAYKRVLQVTE